MKATTLVTIAGMTLLISAGTVWPQSATSRQKTVFQYAVKFVCADLLEDRFSISSLPGTVTEAPLVRGRYLTAINVYNPSEDDVVFTQKAVFATSFGTPEPFHGSQPLGADEAVEIDCLHIRGLPAPDLPLILDKGFLVIKSPVELDVVAVYTARSLVGQVSSIDVLVVQPREMKIGPLVLTPSDPEPPRP